MAGYDAYYSQYVPNGQYGAYDATFMSPKPRAEDLTFDASHSYTFNDTWNMSGGDMTTGIHHNMLSDEHLSTSTPQCGWQQHQEYFDASGEMIIDNWNTAGLHDPANVAGRYVQPIQQDAGLFMQDMIMSSPVTINPNHTIQYPRSWSSHSGTPPNEYHSSGSDGGSDDFHSQYLNFDSPVEAGSSRQSSASPPVGTIEVQPIPTPEPAKPSYYRNRLDKVAAKGQSVTVAMPTPPVNIVAKLPSCAPPLVVQKKRKACSSCKRRKVSCGVPASGSKCNQCSRTGAECDLFHS